MHHHFTSETKDALELAKVGAIGLFGFLATIQLSDWSTIVSIMVGLSVLTYTVAKTVFMIIDRKERKRDGRRSNNYGLD